MDACIECFMDCLATIVDFLNNKSLQCVEIRTVHLAWKLTQPGQPARVRPAATQSDDSGGWTRVLSFSTRPHAGWFWVFRFKTLGTRPEPSPLRIYPFWRYITNFRPTSVRSHPDLVQILRDPARSCCYSTKSGPYLDGSSPYLDGTGQISARSRQIQPDFGQTLPNLTRFQPR